MKSFLDRTRRRVLLCPPEESEVLAHYLEAFAAGFNRGVEDACRLTPAVEWRPLIRSISLELVQNRSALEAGCWLSGVYRGRLDEQRHVVPLQKVHFNQHVRRCFCEEWEASSIADNTLDCDPEVITTGRLIKAVFVQQAHKKIADKLPAISSSLNRQTA